MREFQKELEALINRYSKENESDTPDWILAQYLTNCLNAFTIGVQQRETWYGRKVAPMPEVSKEGALSRGGSLNVPAF